MSKSRRLLSTSAGFTIVETLIVLAIAGLILLIVFEAIPTLERNSRNSQRKQDVATILQAVSNYELKDSGNFPSACGDIASNSCALSKANSNDNFLQYDAGKLTLYDPQADPTAVVVVPCGLDSANGSCASLAANTDPTTVYIYNHAQCSPNGGGAATRDGASYSDVVALFALESGGGTSSQCQQL